jgi:ABC-type methionine transport system ATPase subunit
MGRLSLDQVTLDPLLRSVSLTVEGGEIACVWTRERRARQALLGVAARIDEPEAGSVHATGRVVLAQQAWTAAAGPGVMGQIVVPLLAHGGSVAKARSRALSFLREWRLEEWAARDVSDLDEPDLVRLSLIRALVAAPDVLLLDYPTYGRDGIFTDGVLDVVRAAREQHVAVLLTTDGVEGMRDANALYTLQRGVLRGTEPALGQIVPFVRKGVG